MSETASTPKRPGDGGAGPGEFPAVIPFNLLPIPNANTDESDGHPASTPFDLAAWWCRYILPPKGVLLDMFCGSGTMLAAGLDNRASKVIGIEKERKYLEVAKKRVW